LTQFDWLRARHIGSDPGSISSSAPWVRPRPAHHQIDSSSSPLSSSTLNFLHHINLRPTSYVALYPLLFITPVFVYFIITIVLIVFVFVFVFFLLSLFSDSVINCTSFWHPPSSAAHHRFWLHSSGKI
jgi:hypothetical protein